MEIPRDQNYVTVMAGVSSLDGTTILPVKIDPVTGGVLYTNTAAGSGTVTSVDVSGGTTGLTFTGGPVTTSGTITMAGTLAIANGGTGSTTQNFVDLSSVQTGIGGDKTFTGTISAAGFVSTSNTINLSSATITRSGAHTLTLTTSGATNVTLPTTGTLGTLAGAETFTNKTLTASTNVIGGVTMTLGSDGSFDMYYRNASGVLTRLANGTTGQFLGANTGAAPTWQTPGGGGLTNWTDAVNTSAPNATVPAASLTATNAATNVDAVLAPKGSGAILAAVPDNTATGGNKRGTYAVDLQRSRSSASQVASGAYTFMAGQSNTVSGDGSAALGLSNNVSHSDCFAAGNGNSVSSARSQALGLNNTVSGGYSFAHGYGNTASGYHSVASGYSANNDGKYGRFSRQSSLITTAGESQWSKWLLVGRTTNATAKVLTADNAAADSTNQVILRNSNLFGFTGMVVARQQAAGGTITAVWKIEGSIRRESTAASTTMVASVVTPISNASGLAVALSADTTNGGMAITCTGLAATNIHWVAHIETVEALYA